MVESVLDFWFREIKPAQWWEKDAAFDALIRSRFFNLHAEVTSTFHAESPSKSWRNHAKGALAEIILIDQFSRNMFRDTPHSFAFDGLALGACHAALAKEYLPELSKVEQAFLLMPLMHSEALTDQDLSVQLFTDLGLDDNLRSALRHRQFIERFGRFPHRNAILGRTSTQEELEFLQQPGSSF